MYIGLGYAVWSLGAMMLAALGSGAVTVAVLRLLERDGGATEGTTVEATHAAAGTHVSGVRRLEGVLEADAGESRKVA